MKNDWIKFLANNVEITDSISVATLEAIMSQSGNRLCIVIDGDTLKLRFAHND